MSHAQIILQHFYKQSMFKILITFYIRLLLISHFTRDGPTVPKKKKKIEKPLSTRMSSCSKTIYIYIYIYMYVYIKNKKKKIPLFQLDFYVIQKYTH